MAITESVSNKVKIASGTRTHSLLPSAVDASEDSSWKRHHAVRGTS